MLHIHHDGVRKPHTLSPGMSARAAFIVSLLAAIAGSADTAGAQDPSERSYGEALLSYDVVVYGGTPGGITAGIAAANAGASVLLLEPTGHIGGLTTSGVVTAESNHMLLWTFSGLAREFYDRIGAAYGEEGPVYFFESSLAERIFNEMLAESGVDVLFHSTVDRVQKKGAQIERIQLTDGSSVSGSAFIDATYEGDLMARSGVSYTWGRESRQQYGESLAGIRIDSAHVYRADTRDVAGNLLPGISGSADELTPGAADHKVMSYNFRLCFTQEASNKVPFPAPTHYDPERFRLLKGFLESSEEAGRDLSLSSILDMYPRPNGKFEINNKQNAIISIGHVGGQFDYPDADYDRREEIYEDHKAYTLGLLYFLGHDSSVPQSIRDEIAQWGLCKDEFVDNQNWPYYLYVREARRMVGAYVMTERDVRIDREKTDAIAVGSHFVDSHHVQRVAVTDTTFTNEGRIWLPGRAYQIPYRSITPRAEEATNLLVPVAASFSHVAFSTYRLEPTWMMAGQAAGLAASEAVRAAIPVQQVSIHRLQETLRNQDQIVDFIPGEPVEF